MWRWIEGMKFVLIVWQLRTDGPEIKGQKKTVQTYLRPKQFYHKALDSFSHSSPGLEKSFSVDLEQSSLQNKTVH